MKGLVADCLAELVTGSFGAEKWQEILRRSGLSPDRRFQSHEDVEDALVLRMFTHTCEVGGLSFAQACDVYGAYWVGTYVPKHYPDFYAGVTSARQFLLKLDQVHAAMAARLKGATPPRHDYRWKSENTLAMTYRSERGLIDLFIGGVKGIAIHYGESVTVRKIDDQSVEIDFPPTRSTSA